MIDRRRARARLVTAPLLLTLAAARSGSAALDPPGVVAQDGQPWPSPTAYAETGLELVVAMDGSGDFTTIAEAVDAADAGTTILVRSGEYVETVIVDKDVTLRGDDRASVVVRAPTGSGTCGPSVQSGCALIVRGSDAVVSTLTLGSDPMDPKARGLLVAGGAPFLDRLIVDGPITLMEGSTAQVWDAAVTGDILVSGAGTEPTIQGTEADMVRVEDGAKPLIEGNHIHGLRVDGGGGTVRMNVIGAVEPEVVGDVGIGVRIERPVDWLEITENLIAGHRIGIDVSDGDASSITANAIDWNRVGLRMDALGDTLVAGNAFCRNGTAVLVESGPLPDVREHCSTGG